MALTPALCAVLLDMDGTLLDTGVTVPRAYIATVAELTGSVCAPEDVYRVWHAGTVEGTLAPLIGREATAADVQAYYHHLEESLVELRAYDGVLDAVIQLARRYRLGVVTNASSRAAEMSLEPSGIAPYLSVVIGADDVSVPKPDPEGILEACTRLGVQPGEAAYVGDARSDMQAARAAGVLAVAVAWGHAYDTTAPADLTAASPTELVEMLDAYGRSG